MPKTKYTTGLNGLNLIVEFEGEVLKVYDDGFGYPTVGVGHLLTTAEKHQMPLGTPITRDQSRAWLKQDLREAEDAVNSAVTVPITQNQFDAMVSLAFNIGVAGFKRSSVVRNLNARKFDKAADAFLAWNKARGQVVKGLTRRRTAERKLFLTPDKDSTAAADKTSNNTVDPKNPPQPAENPAVDNTPKNEQDVNETVKLAGPEPYNGKGFAQTIKDDAKAILPANVGLQTISEVAQQATGWPAWVIGLISKIAVIALVVTVGWILFRVIHYFIDTWKKSQIANISAHINTDVRRKNIEFVDPRTVTVTEVPKENV